MLIMPGEVERLYTPNKFYVFNELKEVGRYKDGRTTVNGEKAEAALRELNRAFNFYPVEHYQQLQDALRPALDYHSPPYAVFRDEDSSPDTALIVSFPWANPLVPTVDPEQTVSILEEGGRHPFFQNNWHQLEKHAFLFEIMKALDVRDEAGKTIPVVAVPSPSKDWHPYFDSEAVAKLKTGDFSPFTPYLERILEHEGYGRAHAAGWSLCSGIGQAALHSFINIDPLSGTFGEPLNYKERSRRETFENYVLNKPSPSVAPSRHSDIKWTYDGPDSRYFMEEFQPNIWQHNIWQQGPYNAWLLWGAMGKPTLWQNMEQVAQEHILPITLQYGSTSAMTHDIENYLTTENETLNKYSAARKLRIVKSVGHEAVGAPHLHGESPMFYALWIAESLLWAIETNRKLG